MKSSNGVNNFINRELSWLQFNKRVLEEAQDSSNPLFERLKFAAIFSSNLDEFFMIRVGSLTDQIKADFTKPDPSGLTPIEQLNHISSRAHAMVNDQSNCYKHSLKPALKKEGIVFAKPEELTDKQREFIDEYYLKNVYPVVTPMVVDKSRPFPLILNKSLNIGIILEADKGEHTFGTVQVPSVLDRFIKLPADCGQVFILLEDIIKLNLGTLFSEKNILECSCYRITRNADLSLDEEEAEDLLEAIELSLKQRKWGAAVRLEIEHGMEEELLNILKEELEVADNQIYEINTPMDLTFLMKFYSIDDSTHLKYVPIASQINKNLSGENIFDTIKEKDILLHHPYESFQPIVDMVTQAAWDPNVLAIKQTLYRVSGNSPIVKALVEAAENGKQVTVLVELKARFDEKNNIHWAKRLEESGCHVIYGLVGLKTHCKILLVVRKEEDGIKRYVHMGTGNYNDVTAKIYTDMGLFTCNPYIGSDVSSIFNMLSGHSRPSELYKLSLAPINLRERFLYLIEKETENALKGKKAAIFAKLNALVDKKIIEALYEASKAGVRINLIVRGICCLRPGVDGISDNITVKSIVGRFLEHSRIYCFHNDGDELIYLSSADWMNRNLDRRVELLFPIEDKEARKKVKDILNLALKDTVKARLLHKDGEYIKIDRRGKENLNSQEYLCKSITLSADNRKKELKSNKDKWREEGFKPLKSGPSSQNL
ncbi:RNA degradosome polyphosphate kinase [Clostridium sp. 19966]|uniref:RNA degradosome polyphosphate kinase n=1 Tax=Clostridium sp. 19966 TaxID=2768166 RepID=UPI0028E0400B|nr:RNA degradosome polyphosphate kinase [Clostridium sp. 19966]MDT8717224.1 RNA degradosome polyphosphate kinase [Clostridium sp. 19966]